MLRGGVWPCLRTEISLDELCSKSELLWTVHPIAPLISRAPTMCWGFSLLPHGLLAAPQGGQNQLPILHT